MDTDAENNVCFSGNYPITSEVAEDSSCLGNGGGKARSRSNKKVLRRRSSGGPEMFFGGENNGNDAVRWRRVPESDSLRRRGSLPVDVLIATHHSGDFL